ncbi:MAG: glycosyltransferase [Streptosporangiaceae bacterium]
MIEAIGVVIPAHNEEDLLPGCLAAVRQAAQRVAPVPVRLIVVADACTDRTAEHAGRAGASVLRIGARCVGAARAAGMRQALSRAWHLDPGSLWLATTDADTLVPRGWLSGHLRRAAAGWDAVVGTVTVADWAGRPPQLPAAFRQHYGPRRGAHPHVHGANLGFTAQAYLAAGGFPPIPSAEDHALVAALAATGGRILRTTEVSVRTSARRYARAPHGFGHLLSTLAVVAPPR